jgi:squalene-associated FAD-dependent desaturase
VSLPLDIAVVGAGWAGLAAAVEAAREGARVTLFEMAPMAGGRARDVVSHGGVLDNGQHICIGAYVETLRLLGIVGVVEEDAFARLPLTLVDADGRGLRMRPGEPLPSFVLAVLGRRGWSWGARIALLRVASGWRRSGFRCAPDRTVAGLTAALPPAVRRDFIEPLCVAALNTPAAEASGTVFLRVLRDALAGQRGAADLLLPRRGLGEILPAPALAWLTRTGATIRLTHRVERIESDGAAWRVDGVRADRVVIAASDVEAARLALPHAERWTALAATLRHEPIATVYARSAGCILPEPLLALRSDDARPAQFVFDRGRLGSDAGLLAFVISGAATWVERGAHAIETATLAQGTEQLGRYLGTPLELVRTLVEKRATFACTPGLVRPPMTVAPGLFACGDYIEGPYPATLEGAVRSGVAAARAAIGRSGENSA